MLASVVLFLQGRCFSSEKRITPTFALDSSATLQRGGDVEITLSAVPSFGSRILFEIATPPLHGVLSGLRSISDHTAAIVYHHDGSRSPVIDEFSFKAQAPGQSKSSAARVSIRLTPPPAQLVLKPKELNFGNLPLSETIQTNVIITNLGGVRAVGRLVLPKGFSAPEGDRFSLDEGESVTMKLEFCPMEEMDYLAQVPSLPFMGMEPLTLTGKGTSRIEITKLGTVEWAIKNLSPKPIRLSFTGGVGWIVPQETLLNPDAEKTFSFQQTDLEDQVPASGVSSIVHVSDGLSSRDLELPPPRRFIPVTVQGITPASLGNLPIGVSLPVVFSLINRSEFPKRVTWKASSTSGGGSSAPVLLELLGGEVRKITFDWRPSLPGDASLKVSVEEGTKTRRELAWMASVILPPPMNETFASSNAIVPLQDPVNNMVIQDHPPEVTPAITSIPPLNNISWESCVSWSGKSTVKLTWDAKQGDEANVQITERVMRVNGNKELHTRGNSLSGLSFEIVSTPVEVVRKYQLSSRMVCEIISLHPGWHLVQICRASHEGNPEAQSQIQVFVSQQPSFWTKWRAALGILAIILLIFVLRSFRR